MHKDTHPAATQITASGAAGSATGPASEWRVSKEQLAAAERASLYHARQTVPAAQVGTTAHAA